MSDLTPVMCLDCKKRPALHENKRNELVASCACGKIQNLKVDSATPEDWV